MKKILLATVAAATLTFGSAKADVVTFDESAGNAALHSSFSQFNDNGLTFAFNGGYSYIWGGNSPNSNGTNNLIFTGDVGDYVAITATGGGTFTLNSIDLATSWYDQNPQETLTVNGNPLTITNTLTTYDLNLFDVTEVDISGVPGGGPYWTADNVVFSAAVPEPASMALLGVGVLGLGVIRRRRA